MICNEELIELFSRIKEWETNSAADFLFLDLADLINEKTTNK